MSRPGDCYDNAAVESLFGTLKSELVDHRDYQSRTEAKSEIFEYIEVFYNRQRRHLSLGYLSPIEYDSIAAPNPLSTILGEYHEQLI
jgi:putative transposase